MNKKPKITEKHLCVYHLLKQGHKNAMPLGRISLMAGIDERTVRRLFEDLTLNQMPVCNLMDGSGYFIPSCPDDIAAQIAINAAYKNKFCRKDYALKQAQEHFAYIGRELTGND